MTLGVDELELVEAIARRVVEILDRRAAGDDLIDAREVAQLLGVSRTTVYEHAAELGAIQLGTGSRPRLRWDPKAVVESWRRSGGSGCIADLGSLTPDPPEPLPIRQPRRTRRGAAATDLLPVAGPRKAM